jgi:hypothetical protein
MLKKISTAGALVAILFVLSSIFYNGPFARLEKATVRINTSVGAAIFTLFCIAGVFAIILTVYFFIRMVYHSNSGLTIVDARALTGLSVFSDKYLNERGKKERSLFYYSILWFIGCWLGGALIAIVMYLTLRSS